MNISYGEILVLFMIILVSVITGYAMGVAKIKDDHSKTKDD